MTNSDIVRAAFAALESDNSSSAAEFFSEDFSRQGSIDKVMNKKHYLALLTAIKKCLPDFSLNLRNLQEIDEHTVRGMMAITGTHSGVFVMPSITPVQPTGRHLALPFHPITFTLNDGKISYILSEEVSEGSICGFLDFLGINITELSFDKIFPD
jgi:ketosteroid isomerase-like protein